MNRPDLHSPAVATTMLMVVSAGRRGGVYAATVSALRKWIIPSFKSYVLSAPAGLMASSVTAPLERQFGQVPDFSR